MQEVFKGKNVLITGISGFLGSNLAKELECRGARTVGLVRDQMDWFHPGSTRIVYGSLEDQELLFRLICEYEIEVCFHLGAQAIVSLWRDHPTTLFHTNIHGTWNLLESCRLSRTVQAVVVASSDKVYGESEIHACQETSPLKGRHVYDISKICGEMLVCCYYEEYGMPIATTRCANIYGPGDRNFSRIVPGTIRSFLQGEAPMIRGNGQNLRDYLYVADAVDGYLMLAEKLLNGQCAGEAFNFSTNEQHSVLEIVQQIAKSFPDALPYKILADNLPHEIVHQALCSKKANDQLGWKAQYSLSEGLKRSVEWYAKEYSSSAFSNAGGFGHRCIL